MADSNFANRVEPNLVAEDDPFAELTRIMGHDPRSSSSEASASSQAQDDLALDLESELLGDLAQEDFHSEPRAEVLPFRAASGQVEQGSQPQAPASTQASEDLGDLLSDADFDAAFSAEFDNFDAPAEPQAEEVVQQVAVQPQQADSTPDFELSEQDLAAFDADFAMEEEFAAAEDSSPAFSEPESQEADVQEPAFDFARASASRPDFSNDYAAASEPDYQPVAEQQFEQLEDAAGIQEEASEQAEDWSSEALLQEFSQSMQDSLGAEFSPDAAPAAQTTEVEQSPSMASGGASARFSQPEIETVEVPDEAVPQTDQLDLPEVNYQDEKPAQSEFDDLEELLAGAFGEGGSVGGDEADDQWSNAAATTVSAATVAAAAAPVTATAASDPADFDDDYLESVYQPAAHGNAAYAGVAQNAPHFGAPTEPSWDGFEEGASRLAPAPGAEPPYDTAAPWYQSRNVMAGAAAALGLFILGGVGYYAFSAGEGGASGPVIVRADDGPIKVRPENPGGVTIPNQNNPVYKKVSGSASEPKAEQTELVSNTEEPIDVAARVPAAPAASSNVGAGESAKSEARLETATGQGTDTGADTVTLAPRMVRSLVVRPDGTMAPRELPKPQPQPQAAEVAQPEDAAASGEESASVQQVSLPATPSAVPTQRPSRPAPAQAAPARPAPAQAESARPAAPQQVAAAPAPAAPQAAASQAPAPAATASGWSVQIASQPSAAGAQQSYQQMAQRYGNLLQGRGVNIVKADIAGKGTYYRVRIPSSSKDDAIQLCSQLKSAGGSCFVSK